MNRVSSAWVGKPAPGMVPAPDSNSMADYRSKVSLGPANFPTLQEVVDQFARRVVHLHIERFYAAGEVVEHHDGGNSDQQAGRTGLTSFRNTDCVCYMPGSILFSDYV